MSQTIHHEIVIHATPKRIYEALTDSQQFSAFTGGAPAEISREAGGAFTLFGGHIEGRHVELAPGQRLVQAWRAKSWEEGVYSIVKFDLQPQGSETRLVFDHSGFPETERDHLDGGWHKMYWEPLKKYLA